MVSCKGDNIINNFNEFGLCKEILRGLEKMNFKEPSPVQESAIEPMLKKEDILVQAPTGTGKTAAFCIPIVENTDTQRRSVQSVILSPTRELAVQTAEVLRKLTAYTSGIRLAVLYGGEPINHQIKALKRHPQIIVATPGRLMDHMNRRTVRLNQAECVVLDEADCMLDMGFREDMEEILKKTPQERQTVLFSATMSEGIRKIAKDYQKDAKNISIKQNSMAVDKVEQYYVEMRGNTKTENLLNLFEKKRFKLSLVFVATKAMADKLSNQLNGAGFSADAIHGDLRQRQRDRVMEKYRSGKVSILVATDIAARGIDVNGIDAVINYDIPGDAESYVHRIGRTGRAEKTGIAYTFVVPKEKGKLKGILRETKAKASPLKMGDTGSKFRELNNEGENKRGKYNRGRKKDQYKKKAVYA